MSLLVKLKHQNVATFEEEFATNLSEGGMFIRSRQPQPVGTHLKFEVQLAGGQRVMRGTAVVKWVRQPGDPAGGSGMGVQFELLDDATRQLVDRMLAARGPHSNGPPAPAELPPEVAALEAELRARDAAASAPVPTAVPSIPSVAAVAPVIPSVAAVAPSPAPRPAAVSRSSAAPAPDLSSLFGDEDEPLSPVMGEALDEPLELDLPVELPIEFDMSPAPADAVELPIEVLLEETPPPPPEDPFELLLENGTPSPDEIEIPILDVDLDVDLTDDGVELDDGPSGLELDLDFDARRAPPAQPPARKPPPPPPSVAPAAAAQSAQTARAARAEASLPRVRRDAPTEPAPITPTLVKNEAKPAVRPVVKAGPVFLRPPATIADTGPVIGIDLGTTNSCVALVKNDRPMILSSKEGYNTVPSVISLTHQGKLLLAHRGKSQLILNPSQTIYGAKRLVGRAYDSAVVRQVRERFHYQVVPDQSGRAAVQLGDYVLSLEEVQGLVMKECREMAEQHLGKPVSRAVVTVPAYYSEPQREGVRRSGAMAGLKIERILNEPTAAALAFGLNKELNKKVLVYDLGGGTFDATILKIEKNVFEVLGTGGDVFLGGIDFDNMIVDLLLKRFLEKEGIPFDGDQVALSRVTEAAERAKCALSERSTFDVHIPMLMMDANGVPRELRCTVTREEVEKVTEGLVTRTLDVVRDVLLDAQIKAKDVDEIIVVGGMSRMPLVRDKLKEMFGKLPHAGVNADEAVALGAALYSGTVDKVSSVTLIDVLPMTIGVGLPGGGFRRVIERNTALPAQRSFALATSQDDETAIEFSVFQGEETNVAGNEYLGTVRIEGLPKMPKGAVKVAVTLRLDAECVLHVEASELSTRKAIKATLATRYTSEEVQKKLGITAEKAREVEERRAKELDSRGGGFWGFLKKTFRRK